MYKHLVIGCFISLLASTYSIPVQAQSKSDIQQKYVKFLSEKGYFTKIDSDGDVQFQKDGKTFFIEVNEDDLGFFRVVCPNIWDIESETERNQAYKACQDVNAEGKVVKAYVTNDNVWVSCELFCATLDDYEAYFDRCLRAIESGIDTFVDGMRE